MQSVRNSIRPFTVLITCCLGVLVSACGGGGGSAATTFASQPVIVEAEPNNASTTAQPLEVGRHGTGALDVAGDVDFWSVDLSAGQVIELELLAARLDHAGWAAGSAAGIVSLFDVDGTTRLIGHTPARWVHGRRDFDVPRFRVPASGTYFIAVTTDVAAPGGRYAVRVNTPLGTAASQAMQFEVEPEATSGGNESIAAAQPIQPGTIHGFHVDNESDYYSFTIGGPTLVRMEVFGYRNGTYRDDDARYDSGLELYDSSGLRLEYEDDSFFYDQGIQWLLGDAGEYYVNVRECCGTGDAPYFLDLALTSAGTARLESEPNDDVASADPIAHGQLYQSSIAAGEVDVFSFQGIAGDMLQFQAFDSLNSTMTAQRIGVVMLEGDGTTTLPATAGGDFATTRTILQTSGIFYIQITGSLGTAGDYHFTLRRTRGAAFESEPNDDPLTADSLDGNGRAAGLLEASDSVDVFAFNATADTVVRFVGYARTRSGDGSSSLSGHGSTLLANLRILDAAGTELAFSDSGVLSPFALGINNNLPSNDIAFVAPTSGVYYLRVENAAGSASPRNHYIVERQ